MRKRDEVQEGKRSKSIGSFLEISFIQGDSIAALIY